MNIQDTKLIQTIPTTEHFQKTILSHYNRMLDQAFPDEPSPSIHFITTKFNEIPNDSTDALARRRTFSGKYPETEERIQIVHQWQFLFYKHILNQTVSNAHFPSKSKHYPVALCFIDFPGSRFHQPRITEMPHFHSIFVVPSRTKLKFDQVIADGFRLDRCPEKTKFIQSFNCQHLASTGQDLHRNVDYSSKLLRLPVAKQFSAETRASLFVMYGKV